jgi:hypothetical protein
MTMMRRIDWSNRAFEPDGTPIDECNRPQKLPASADATIAARVER